MIDWSVSPLIASRSGWPGANIESCPMNSSKVLGRILSARGVVGALSGFIDGGSNSSPDFIFHSGYSYDDCSNVSGYYDAGDESPDVSLRR